MVEYTEEQKQEIRDLIAAAQNRQAFFEQAKTWFNSSLSESLYKVQQGQMLQETHDAGNELYRQFINDWTKPKTSTPAAEPVPSKEDETE